MCTDENVFSAGQIKGVHWVLFPPMNGARC